MRHRGKLFFLSIALTVFNPVTRTANAKPSQKELGLQLIVGEGDIDRVKQLLAQGAPINAQDGEGNSALGFAAEIDEAPYNLDGHPGPYRSLNLLKLILSHRPKINIRTVRGFTPVMGAAASFCLPAVQMLVQHGADVNARSDEGFTALHAAIGTAGDGYGSAMAPGVVSYLLTRGANPNAATNDGVTPLIELLQSGDVEPRDVHRIAKLLLANGADVNKKTRNGNTALKWARIRRYQGLEQVLKQAGARG